MNSVVMKSLLLLAFCFTQLEAANLKVSRKSYGRTAAGEKVHEFTLQIDTSSSYYHQFYLSQLQRIVFSICQI